MYNSHLESNAFATLVVRKRETSRYFIFDESNILHGWMNVKTGEIKLPKKAHGNFKMLAFSGIQILSPEVFEFMADRKGHFSIVDVYLEAAESYIIKGFQHDEGLWLDVGKRENLIQGAMILDQISLGD